jgi:hypothetical protein
MPAPGTTPGCLGFAGFAAVAVVAVLLLLFAAVELGVLAAGADAPTSPVLSPGFVTRNVIARRATPSNAMIAGRGSSIREAVGKVGGVKRSRYCVFGT